MELIKNIRKYKINKIMTLLFLFVLSTVFVSGFSTSTSPFFNFLGADSAIFRLIGQALKNDKLLYVDITDNKGPVLFFIEYLGQILHDGRTGIYIVQIILLAVSLILIYLIARIFLKRNIAWTLPVIFTFLLTNFYQWGNLSEEYSLPFCFLAIYLLLKNLNTKLESSLYLYAGLLVSGSSLALVALIRLNNSVSIIAMTIVYALSLVFALRWKELTKQASVYLLGFLATVLIVFGYFYIYNSLYDMFYAMFLFNLKYSKFSVGAIPELFKSGYLQWAIVALSVGLLGATVNYLNRKEVWNSLSVGFVSVFSFIAVIVSVNGYFHYLQLMLVPIILGAIMILRYLSEDTTKKLLFKHLINFTACALIVFILHSSFSNIFDYNNVNNKNTYISSSREADVRFAALSRDLTNIIPGSDRDDIFGYNVPASFYVASGILPSHRFFSLQDWWGSYDEAVYIELEFIFINEPPKWLLLNDKQPIANQKISRIVSDKYVVIKKLNGTTLMKLNQKFVN